MRQRDPTNRTKGHLANYTFYHVIQTKLVSEE